jgi:spore coat polysaccharide biosynthesis protein SpsF
MKIAIVTQARVGSSRLPEKVLRKIQNQRLLEIHLKRVSKSKLATHFIVATTHETGAEQITTIARECNWQFYKGDTQNVLQRFCNALENIKPDWVVRITSDCPLIDAELIDQVIEFTIHHKLDYCSNSIGQLSFPDGQDVEVFTYKALLKAQKEALLLSDKEHVTPYIWRNSNLFGATAFTSLTYENQTDYSGIRMTVDEESDFQLIKKLVEDFGTEQSWEFYAKAIRENKALQEINSGINRNEGYLKSLKND